MLAAVLSRAVTIDDVARAAGVSPATVSRVLNGTREVSSDRAERVRAAVAELGYQPMTGLKRISPFELEGVANLTSLHADPQDPLDP